MLSRINFKLIIAIAIIFSLMTCGLDNVVYLEVPYFERQQASYQDSEQYLLFRTSDTANISGYYRGFEVLYKIYATAEELNKDVSAIQSYNNSNPQASARYVLETKKYQRLQGNSSPLVVAGGANRLVRIRLYDYGTAPDIEKKGLYVDNMPPSSPIAQLRRFDGSEFKKLPNNTIVDDISKTTTKEEYKLVAFFAVTVGLDEQFVALYSEVLYLGFLHLQ